MIGTGVPSAMALAKAATRPSSMLPAPVVPGDAVGAVGVEDEILGRTCPWRACRAP